MAKGKIDYMKYAALGAGGVAVPKIVMMVPQVTGFLANVPMIADPLWEGVSILGIALAGLGVGLVDQLAFKK